MKNIIAALGLLAVSAAAGQAQTFTLCEGQHSDPGKNKCAVHGAYAPCYASNLWAQTKCKKVGGSGAFQKTKLLGVHGDLCGYTSWRIVCLK